MAKYYPENFIKWALTHVKRSTIPSDAKLPLPIAKCVLNLGIIYLAVFV